MLTGKDEVKLLTAGLGWAAAHSLLTNPFVLLVGARHTGFSWPYIQTAFESNIDLVCDFLLIIKNVEVSLDGIFLFRERQNKSKVDSIMKA
jgi:hypothetical protein